MEGCFLFFVLICESFWQSRNFYNLDGKYEDEGGEVVDLVEAGWVDAEAIREEEEEVVDSDDPFWS